MYFYLCWLIQTTVNYPKLLLNYSSWNLFVHSSCSHRRFVSFSFFLLKPQQINNCWCLLDPAGLALFSMFCVCVPAHSQAGAVVGHKELALTEQEHPGSIFFFFLFGFPWKTQSHQKEDFSTGRQKKFAAKMVTSWTNVTLPSAEVIDSLFGTYVHKTKLCFPCMLWIRVHSQALECLIYWDEWRPGWCWGRWGLWEQLWVPGEGSCQCSHGSNAFEFTI